MRYEQGNATASSRTFIERGLAACFLVFGLLAATTMSHAQLSEAGTINGTVTDQTGAVIPGAAITITNVGTGTVTLTTTNGAGSFSQVGLNVGNYSVGVMITGFQTFQENNFYLGPTQIYTANVVLKTGQYGTVNRGSSGFGQR